MLLPDLLNRNSLFKTLNGLNSERNHVLSQTKDEVFSRGTSALLHLIRIQDLNNRCVTEFGFYENQLTNIKDERIVYSSESLGYLLNEISPLITTLRLLQDLTLKLLRNLGNKSLPKSISNYFKKPDKHKLNVDVHQTLETYWRGTGKQLKHYRDIDQHYSWLTGRYFMQIEGRKKVLIEFPDNPESKSPKKFTFSKKINAIDFLNEAFKEIHEVFEEIAKLSGAKEIEHTAGVSLSQLGELTPFANRTLSFMDFKYLTKDTNDNSVLHLEGIGMDQREDGRLSIRKYFLDEGNLEKAKKYYG